MLTLRNSPTMISPKCSFLKQTGVVITPRNFGNKDEKKSKIYPFHSDGYRGYPSPEVDESKDEYRKCSGVLIRDNLVLVSQDCLGPSKPYEISVVFGILDLEQHKGIEEFFVEKIVTSFNQQGEQGVTILQLYI